jgi:predicted RNase H-like nuclease (RuvC/YqgF family)
MGEIRCVAVWQSRRGTVGSGVDDFGTKGASMNQIMVNAVEFDSLLKEVEYLKHENQKLKEQLKDTQDRIRILKEEVGFAERGYTKL